MTADYMSASFLALKTEVTNAITPLQKAAGKDPDADPANPPKPEHTARKIQEVAGSVGGVLGVPLQLMNTGFALLTSKISDMLPKFMAATKGSLYVAPLPHCHSHPLSLIPPLPPIPLPSLGPVMFGTSPKVLINGKPAARAGDIGVAPTCFGFTPFFEVLTGSSKVFIGGQRAARAIDICWACKEKKGGGMDAFGIASLAIGTLATGAGIVADKEEAEDASAEGDAAMASAKALSASMAAEQLKADAIAMVIKALMGKDPSVAPLISTPGMITEIGCSSTVLIAGFPMVNFPDPVAWLFGKLKGKFGKGKKEKSGEGEEGCTACMLG